MPPPPQRSENNFGIPCPFFAPAHHTDRKAPAVFPFFLKYAVSQEAGSPLPAAPRVPLRIWSNHRSPRRHTIPASARSAAFVPDRSEEDQSMLPPRKAPHTLQTRVHGSDPLPCRSPGAFPFPFVPFPFGSAAENGCRSRI